MDPSLVHNMHNIVHLVLVNYVSKKTFYELQSYDDVDKCTKFNSSSANNYAEE